MAVPLPSRTWSCETLQRGLCLAQVVPMDSRADPDVAAMERELELLKVWVDSVSNRMFQKYMTIKDWGNFLFLMKPHVTTHTLEECLKLMFQKPEH